MIEFKMCVLIRRGRYVKTQLPLYPIYQAIDMFRPMWAILRSQKCIMGKTTQCKIISCGTYQNAVAQWLRCCATNRKVAGSIPASASEFFIDIKFFRSHYGPGGKGGRCVRLTTYHHPVPLSRNLGTLTSWNPLGPFGPETGLLYLVYTLEYVPQRIYPLVICIKHNGDDASKVCFDFLQLLSEKFLNLNAKCYHSCHFLIKLDFSHVSEKFTNIKFNENSSIEI